MTRLVRLFEPIDIGSTHVKNRIVFPAVGTRFAGVTGEASQRDVDHFRARARWCRSAGGSLGLGGNQVWQEDWSAEA